MSLHRLLELVNTDAVESSWKQSSTPLLREFSIPTNLFKALREKWPAIKIHLVTEGMKPILSRFPVSLPLNSCRLGSWNFDLDHPYHVTGLLLSSPTMDKLHLISIESHPLTLRDSLFASSLRLPALKELRLEAYNWTHSPLIANRFWNWTNIRHLELARVSVVKFLQTVSLEHLSQLQTFITDGYCEERVLASKDKEQMLASSLIYSLIGKNCLSPKDCSSMPYPCGKLGLYDLAKRLYFEILRHTRLA